MQPLAGHTQVLVLDPFVQKPPVSTGCDHFEMSPDESARPVVGWSSGVDSNSSAENTFQSQTETFWCLQSLNLCEGRKEWRREGKHWNTPGWHRIKTWLSLEAYYFAILMICHPLNYQYLYLLALQRLESILSLINVFILQNPFFPPCQ